MGILGIADIVIRNLEKSIILFMGTNDFLFFLKKIKFRYYLSTHYFMHAFQRSFGPSLVS